MVEVQENDNPDSVGAKEPVSFPDTIWKSSYYLGEHQLTFFMNYRKVDGDKRSYSFIIKKGKWPTYYNLTYEERLSFAKRVMQQLSFEEQQKVMREIDNGR